MFKADTRVLAAIGLLFSVQSSMERKAEKSIDNLMKIEENLQKVLVNTYI